ncbi:hypothetical protein ACROYT_G016300 [Oculina patagonica]
MKPSRAKAVLNDTELIEIFGSSDEEDDNISLFKFTQSSCTTMLKGDKRATRLDGLKSRSQVPGDVFDSSDAIKCLQRPLQQVKTGFSSDTGHSNTLVENCSEVKDSSKDCIVKRFTRRTEKCDSVDGICSDGSSGKLQGHKSLKENADSPFDDYMPAPLSKRLGKHFSAKQRLASLHSISSVTDDFELVRLELSTLFGKL